MSCIPFLKNFWRWIIPWQCGQWGRILVADGPKCLTTLVSQLANTVVMEIRSRPWVKGRTQHLTFLCLHCISSFSDVQCIPGVISAMKSCNLLFWGTHPHSLTPAHLFLSWLMVSYTSQNAFHQPTEYIVGWRPDVGMCAHKNKCAHKLAWSHEAMYCILLDKGFLPRNPWAGCDTVIKFQCHLHLDAVPQDCFI